MIPADSTIKQTTLEKIAKRYGVSGSTATSWSLEPSFPGFLGKGWGKTQLYDEATVDEWVLDNKPEAWVVAHPKQKEKATALPAGDPNDLMPLKRIGELEGRFLSRQATPVATLRTYISKDILARPDRRPDDGGSPAVEQDMWFRRTAYDYITRRRNVRRKTAVHDQREPSSFLKEYFEENPGLLTLEEIAELDGKEHGRKPTALSTLNSYISQGKLARPDREPGDDEMPAVKERMWMPETALPYLCRPTSRRSSAASTEATAAEVQPSEFLRKYFEKHPGLLTLEEIAELDGREQGRPKATALTTLRVYISQGKLARPDRVPGDSQTPAVDEQMWTPGAALPFLATPRQASRGKAAPVAAAAHELREPSAYLKKYFEKHSGLLTLKKIAELDAREQGREKPTAESTLRAYLSRGLLARPDRLPNDGKLPAVHEQMWAPGTALPYLLRPLGRRGSASKANVDGGLQDSAQ
ncbi:hypothetical protein ACODT5_01085 [Streptomyces sp. 5.8]|uniref:hypothetical protein n=1 Tax=Streptomyces sp. 5.8 TaxID=3406571 RepID=UPI003BB6B077